jgi:serine/threonine protein kinase/DNA-binding beta-propeller fold protein YncE
VSNRKPQGPGGFGPGSTVAGYRLDQMIGQGGMAVVYRAYDRRLQRRVALKILAPELARDKEFRLRFIRESRAAAAVDHPNIIPIFEAGESAGVLFIAMRFVEGHDVRTLLEEHGTLAAERVCAIVSQVAAALDVAHSLGLVHRDVKPANMLRDATAYTNQPDHIYLSDFGLSKRSLASTGLTSRGHFLGTLNYISPEQIEGRKVDGRADLYGLACSAFEMLIGEPPFKREDNVAIMYAQLNAPPPPVAPHRPDLPAAAAIDEVMARALAKKPDDRYATCLDFAIALRRACGLHQAQHGPRLTGPGPSGWGDNWPGGPGPAMPGQAPSVPPGSAAGAPVGTLSVPPAPAPPAGPGYPGTAYPGTGYQGEPYQSEDYQGAGYQGEGYQGEGYQGSGYQGGRYQGEGGQGSGPRAAPAPGAGSTPPGSPARGFTSPDEATHRLPPGTVPSEEITHLVPPDEITHLVPPGTGSQGTGSQGQVSPDEIPTVVPDSAPHGTPRSGSGPHGTPGTGPLYAAAPVTDAPAPGVSTPVSPPHGTRAPGGSPPYGTPTPGTSPPYGTPGGPPPHGTRAPGGSPPYGTPAPGASPPYGTPAPGGSPPHGTPGPVYAAVPATGSPAPGTPAPGSPPYGTAAPGRADPGVLPPGISPPGGPPATGQGMPGRRPWITRRPAIAIIAVCVAALATTGGYLLVKDGGNPKPPARAGLTISPPACTTQAAAGQNLTNVHVSQLDTGKEPFDVEVAPGGYGFASFQGGIAVLSTSRPVPKVIGTVRLPGAQGEALTPDNRFLVVAAGSGISVYSVSDLEHGPVSPIGSIASPHGVHSVQVAVSPDSKFAFATLEGSDQVAVFNLAQAEATRFKPSASLVGDIPVSKGPVGLELSPDGRYLYVATGLQRPAVTSGQGTLTVIDAHKARTSPATSVIGKINAGCGPDRLVVSPDGKYVWVTSGGGNALLGYNAASLLSDPQHALAAKVPLGELPLGIAFVDQGKLLVVADSNRDRLEGTGSNLAVVSVAKALAHQPGALLGFIKSGTTPRNLTLERNGKTLLVTNTISNEIYAVDISHLQS